MSVQQDLHLTDIPKFLNRKLWTKKRQARNKKYWDEVLKEERIRRAAITAATEAKRHSLLAPHPWEGETIRYRPGLNDGDRFAMNSLGWTNEVLDRLSNKALREILKHPRKMTEEDEENVVTKPELTKVFRHRKRSHLPMTEEEKAVKKERLSKREEHKEIRHELGNKILAAIEDGSDTFTKIQQHTGLEIKNQIYQGLRYLLKNKKIKKIFGKRRYKLSWGNISTKTKSKRRKRLHLPASKK